MSDPVKASPSSAPAKEDFALQAEQPQTGLIREFALFLLHNKKWWLAPILIVLVIVAGLVILGGTAVAPFIYTLY